MKYHLLKEIRAINSLIRAGLPVKSPIMELVEDLREAGLLWAADGLEEGLVFSNKTKLAILAGLYRKIAGMTEEELINGILDNEEIIGEIEEIEEE